jgi:hypothetical protein
VDKTPAASAGPAAKCRRSRYADMFPEASCLERFQDIALKLKVKHAV